MHLLKNPKSFVRVIGLSAIIVCFFSDAMERVRVIISVCMCKIEIERNGEIVNFTVRLLYNNNAYTHTGCIHSIEKYIMENK